LSVVDGLLDETGQRIDLVQHAGDARSLARDETSARGRGGMASKLEAVRRMTDAGEIAVIAHGREPDVLLRLLDGEPLGTVFTPAARKLSARRRWIGLTKRASGVLVVDDGAVRALTQRGKSLLAIGIREVQYLGPRGFERGDVLAIHDTTGREIGLGLTNYGLAELRRIQGQPSTQFSELLGRDPTAVLDEEVIHRDNLAITGEGLAVANQRS